MPSPQVRPHYKAVFVSPHLDDAVFSCGGTIARLVEEGPVLVFNLFTDFAEGVNQGALVSGPARYQEEIDAAQFLGFESRNLGELDVLFRRPSYKKLGNIFRPPIAEDIAWLPSLREKVFAVLAKLDYEQLYVPLGIGWHVDHVLTYQLFEPWAGRPNLFYYEDAPYCCIPHSTRYRLNELANYHYKPSDQSLAPMNETRAWWQAAMSYADTALMKNLKPWFIRQFAVPVVSYYLHRLMALQRKVSANSQKVKLSAMEFSIDLQIEKKVSAMALYTSQFNEFFLSREDCIQTLTDYSTKAQAGRPNVGVTERFWVKG